MDHLCPEHVTLLSELARFHIAAHEAARAVAEPRSEAAANFAAAAERATQDMLRRALALGDHTPVEGLLREMARRLGVTLDESSADWRALAFEALRVMLDVARERERREVGTYAEPTPIFRSVMASRSAAPAAVLPTVAAQAPAPALTVPAAAAPPAAAAAGAIPPALQAVPAATAPAGCEGVAPVRDKSEVAAPPVATTGPAATSMSALPPAPEAVPAGAAFENADIACRIKARPPRLENIDMRELSPEMQEVLRTKPRGITLLEGIQIMKELKLAGYGDDFSVEQAADEAAGKKWKSNSGSKANFCEKFWVEFVGDVPFENADRDDIRDALKILPDLPYQHSKGTEKFVATNGFRALVDDIDAEEERAEKDALKALGNGPDVTEADREKARLDARIPRLRAETRAKHRGYMKSVGKMLYDLQLIDRNPFEICAVSNKTKAKWKKAEEKRKRICWDDPIYTFLRSPVFQEMTCPPRNPSP